MEPTGSTSQEVNVLYISVVLGRPNQYFSFLSCYLQERMSEDGSQAFIIHNCSLFTVHEPSHLLQPQLHPTLPHQQHPDLTS